MAEIELDKISKQFPGGPRVLQETSFTIHDGEFFILVGPSGCGKSTLLNMIIGLEEIDSGEIRVDGRVVNDLDPKDRNMAMVFQSYAIYPHMTVYDNIAFPLKLVGLSKSAIRQKVSEAAHLLELTELLERKPAALSGGQRQRVAMGRALVRDPDVFLLDEPLSNLDARLRVQMRGEIGRLQKRLGTTMIYVTHDQTEAMTLGDRVAVLNQGAVQQIGAPRQLYRNPANLFVAGFIGSPGMNFAPAEITPSQLILPFGSLNLPKPYQGQSTRQAIAGFRPEAVSCTTNSADSEAMLCFEVEIDNIEWLGAELFAYAEVDFPETNLATRLNLFKKTSCNLVFRLDPTNPIRSGESLKLKLNIDDIHLFDPITGAHLS